MNREIELREKGDAGEGLMEIRDDAMNMGWMIVTNETDFIYKKLSFFSYKSRFIGYGNEERNREDASF